MKGENITYPMILEVFGEDKIGQRFEFLYEKAQNYIDSKEIGENVYINKSLLQQVVLDYFTDIYRLKIFHGIDKVNATKIIAYETYWFLKRKPIQIASKDSDNYIFVNENFLTIFLAHELLYPDDKPMTDAGEEKYLSFLKHLSYHLKYREIDKQSIEIMLLSFETGKEMYQDAPKQIHELAL